MNAKIGVTYVAVNPEIEAEKTADHLRRIREEFDYVYKTRTPINAAQLQSILIRDSVRWYGKNDTTDQMIKDFNSY